LKNKPVLSQVQDLKKPVITHLPESKWLFSFKDFQQIENFGLNGKDSGYFASVFYQLKTLSSINIDDLQRNFALKDSLRYHVIDWNARNIPLQRQSFSWVSNDILSNEEEFPFYQFHISQALGRVIGYWQENIFNILLLDPMHNMQPSSYANYQIRAAMPVDSDISVLLSEVDRIKQMECENEHCIIKSQLLSMSRSQKNSNALIFFLDDDFLSELNQLCAKHSLSKLLENGLLRLV
jgi:hypothetical protein